MMSIQSFREKVPMLSERSYLFAGGVAPAASPVANELRAWVEQWLSDPVAAFDRHAEDAERLRRALGVLFGAPTETFTITTNASEAANRAIGMLGVVPDLGPVVLVDDTTFPSSIYPWRTKTDKRVEYVSTDLLANPEWLAERLSRGDVGVVAITHTANQTGYKHDLTAVVKVARAAGTVTLVDVSQSAGVEPIAAFGGGADVMIGTCLKWLMGIAGIGFLYIRPELRQRLDFADCGYLLAELEDSVFPREVLPSFPRTGAALELGISAIPCLAACAAGVELVNSVGPPAIRTQVEGLVDEILDGLRERNVSVRTPEERSRRGGVVSAIVPGADRLCTFLRDRGVDIGGWANGILRIDPHGYNSSADIVALFAGFDAWDELGGAQ